MKIECIKHGETEGIRQDNGRLGCKLCLESDPKSDPPVKETTAEEKKKIADQFKKAAGGNTKGLDPGFFEELFKGIGKMGKDL